MKSPALVRLLAACAVIVALAGRAPADEPDFDRALNFHTDTPIKHLVVIFQENVSFDHYFATYPNALNSGKDPVHFHAKPGTPSVNNLDSAGLLTMNPNLRQPFRLDRAGAITGDMDHGYTDEQLMYDGGLMDHFVQANMVKPDPSVTMAYFDGNTVTALWNYAQHFAMSDNAFCTGFGPSTPGVLNLVAAQTNGAVKGPGPALDGDVVDDGHGGLTVIDDGQPSFDIGTSRENFSMTGQNIGNLLNKKKLTWGWFQGGFCAQPDPVHPGKRVFVFPGPVHTAPGHAGTKVDYIPHHAGFQYYPSTANPNHLQAASVDEVGHDGVANHNYDLIDFDQALADHNLPAVSFVKAPGYQDGHAGYSDPLAEQTFIVETINKLMKSPEWKSMAIVITYDDSDGWYDHQMGPIVSQSNTPADALLGPGNCGTPAKSAFNGRAGYGCRIPFLVVSPFARKNWVSHKIIDQASVIRFVEDNWDLPRIGNQSFDAIAGTIDDMFDFKHGPHPHKLILDPSSGQP
jgi:phospholipase C